MTEDDPIPPKPHGPKSIRKKEPHELTEQDRAYGRRLAQIKVNANELVKTSDAQRIAALNLGGGATSAGASRLPEAVPRLGGRVILPWIA